MVQVVALAGALAHAREYRVAAVRLGDVVDQLHDQHGLADAGPAEQADLAALGVGGEQVHDLDAGFQDLRLGGLVGVARGRLVDGAQARGVDGARLIDRLADHVDDAAERSFADRHPDGRARVGDLLAAGQALGNVHGDAAHRVLAEVLGHLQDEAVAVVGGFQRVQDGGQVVAELHVHDGADYLRDVADRQVGAGGGDAGARALDQGSRVVYVRHDAVPFAFSRGGIRIAFQTSTRSSRRSTRANRSSNRPILELSAAIWI